MTRAEIHARFVAVATRALRTPVRRWPKRQVSIHAPNQRGRSGEAETRYYRAGRYAPK